MKTFEQLAADCANDASKSWKGWTKLLIGIRITSCALLAGGIGMQFITNAWAGGIILILGSIGLFIFSRTVVKDRLHFWNRYMEIRQDCLNDAQKFKSL